MKEKQYKIIFFIVIIILLIISIYLIYINKTSKEINLSIIKSSSKIANNINIGIIKYDTLNPILSKNEDIQYISKLIYSPLIEITKDFCLEPGLATEWSKLNKTTYLIKLKENILWQNGKEFNAEDVIYTVNIIKNNESIYKDNIKNIEKIEIIDEYTIKIYLNKETNFFEYYLSFPIILEDENIGIGKYKISEILENNIKLERNSDFEATKLQTITIKIYEDINGVYHAFSNGEVDVINTKNTNFTSNIGNYGYDKELVAGREFEYLLLNANKGVLQNDKVREAIKYAINNNEIAYKLYNNLYIPAEFPLEYGSYLYEKIYSNKYDINKSKKILQENGWNFNGTNWSKKGQRLNITFGTTNKNLKLAEIIKEQLIKIGLSVNIIEISQNQYEYNIENNSYDILLASKKLAIIPSVSSFYEEDLSKIEDIENKDILKQEYKKLIEKNEKENNFIGLHFNSNIILYSQNLRGNFSGNWFNIFCNIDTWYKIK